MKQQFNRWKIIDSAKKRQSHIYWLCKCECGTIREVREASLISGYSGSCGCLQKELATNQMTTHGGSKDNEYTIWAGIIRRCYDPRDNSYKNYGGRGIRVCQRWLSNYDNYIKDMGPRPSTEYSTERINNEGDYEPSNCRWATSKEQANNRRDNVRVIYKGKHITVSDLAKKHNIKIGTLASRIFRYNKSPAEALKQKLRPVKKRNITHNGKTQSLKEWAKELSMTYHSLYYRLYISGWSVGKALTK